MRYFLSLLSITRKIFGYRVFLFGIAAGLSNTALISIINETIKYGIDKKAPSLLLFFGYITALLLYFLLQYFYQSLLIKSAQTLILQSRETLIEKIRKSNLRSYEKVGSTRLFVLLAHDTNTIGTIATLSSSVIIALIVISGSLIYLLSISIKGFLLTVGIISVSLLITFSMQKANIKRIKKLLELETVFLNFIRNMLTGIKEVKMDSKISEGIYNTHLKPYMNDIHEKKTSNNISQARFALLGQLIFFITMGFILFVFPMLQISITRNPAQFVIVLLYILSPIQMLIPLIPQFSHIKATMERMASIKDMLEEEPLSHTTENSYKQFETISFKDVIYTYEPIADKPDFRLGPVNFDIQAGDLIFILGENGSGKSTLIKVLTGLYTANKGSIQLDDDPISHRNIQLYRNLFGVIFTDNHLFEHLYGVDDISTAHIDQLIEKTGLTEKVNFQENRFNTIDLSEGQKKRIALINVLLRDKPIYIFDEWAANQDPDFRDYFYNVLIPELNNQQKTVIVITHDDRYLHIAKRLFKMEDGLLEEVAMAGIDE
ncbi:cyclic peptide export ABC transporter [Niastella populi]|nr:cyclic peptide export ABC transporter [Niastella populi]